MPGPLLSRRSVLGALVGGGSALALAGCSPPTTGSPAMTATPPATPSGPSPATPSGRVLLAYFSRPGENYWYGGRRTLQVGNTEVLARMIGDQIGCDVHRIEAAEPYPAGYDDTVARNVREQEADTRPAIANALPDLSAYGTVLLASPIWNVQPPMIMRTFAEGVDLAGRVVLPVTTHAMSGLGRAPEIYAAVARGARTGEGLAVRGERVSESADQVRSWLAARELA